MRYYFGIQDRKNECLCKFKVFLYFVFFFLITIGVFWCGLFFYIYFLIPSKMNYTENKNQFPLSHYEKKLIFKVGWIEPPEERSNYFLNFRSEKNEGVIRIGAFGDSWTYGSEVIKGQSYPAQLKEFFNKFSEINKIEVLNFGVGGHGFSQSFVLWQEYGKKYNLDYILLGLLGFFDSSRNISFLPAGNDVLQNKFLPPIKGRYILETNYKGQEQDQTGLQFINIKGKNFLERYRNYYSVFPSWKVLKYDSEFFQFWWNSFFPHFRGMKNPFYYTDLSEEEEGANINKILLSKMNKFHNKRILLLEMFTNESDMYEEVKNIYNFNRIDIFEKTDFLYERKNHLSSLGNEMLAAIYFNALKGRKNFSLKMFRCYKNRKKKSFQNFSVKNNPVNRFFLNENDEEDIEINLVHNNLKIGELLLQSQGDRLDIPRGTKSLIGFFGSNDFFTEGVFIPLSFQLHKTSRVFIQAKGREKIPLGYVFPIDEIGFLWGFQADSIFIPAFPKYSSHRLIWNIQKDIITLLFPKNVNQKFVGLTKSFLSLWVQDYKIADLEPTHKDKGEERFVNWLRPEEPLVFIGPGHHIRHDDMPEMLDRISLQYVIAEDKTKLSLIPDWYCKKKQVPVHMDLPNLDFL